MKFSLIHPSRNRLQLADQAITEWKGKCSGQNELEYILSIDVDDDNCQGYRRIAERHEVQLIINRNRSIVDAVNRAAELTTGDVLIVVSDDFGCPQAWDVALADTVGERRDVAVLVHDAEHGRIMTLPILGRSLYERLGYVYYHEYFSMYADDDITELAARMGKLVDARHLVFPHRYTYMRGSTSDLTYARQNSPQAFMTGERVLGRRRALDFGRQRLSLPVIFKILKVDAYYVLRRYGGPLKRLFRRMFS